MALYAAGGVIGVLVIVLVAVTIAYLRVDEAGTSTVAAPTASDEVVATKTSAMAEDSGDQSPVVLGSAVIDASGFVGTHARCGEGEHAAAVGRTAQSLVVICETSGSGYEYRAVRLADGATVSVADTRNDGYAFSAWNGDMTYTVSSGGLGIASNNRLIASEPMLEYRGPMLDPNLGVTAQPRPGVPSTTSMRSTPAPTAPRVLAADYPTGPLTGQGSGYGELRFTAASSWHIDFEVACSDDSEVDGYIDTKSVMTNGSEVRVGYEQGVGFSSGSTFGQGPSSNSGSSRVRTETGPAVAYMRVRPSCSWQVAVVYE
ncbi:hypothetical protein FFI94_033070 [Rhodococcus sp. KBS0724]|uniref:hypothetical protein n=1 Tax=Rhodococcus sp. KBS0724 TaxID=1179674 RepID=UPI001184E77D|nr:hypothetical protein [Rhodococcus sp. KBS0724]TSD40519.1 hypothetical protein FFI94_033070 [Rhodococcus sp. KBS0724]